jgi:hypothetical protein
MHRWIVVSFTIALLAVYAKYCSWPTVISAYLNGPAMAEKTCRGEDENFGVRFDRVERDTYIEFKCVGSPIQHEGLYDHGDTNWLD